MRTQLKIALFAALPLVTVLWMTPIASAHDNYRYHQRRPAWSYSTPSRHWHSGRYNNGERRFYGSSRSYGENHWKYNKAMNRLARQEREAREKAYRNYDGNRGDPRYQQRLGEIDRKYDHKRDKVERNLRKDW